MDRLTGIHAVREALEANRPLDSLMVAQGTHGNRIEELVRLARKLDVPVRFEERIQFDRAAGTREHQGVVALVSASPVASFDDLIKPRDRSRAHPGCWCCSMASKTRKIWARSCERRSRPARKAS